MCGEANAPGGGGRVSHRTRQAVATTANASPAARWVLPLLLCAIGLAVFVTATLRLNLFMVDDVFISLRYGRHWLAGLGLVYNPGERVEGYTNFLWTVLAAPSVIAPIGVFPYLRLLNGAFALLAAWQAGVLLARLQLLAAWRPAAPGTRAEPVWMALGAAMFLCTPAVLVSNAEGLETMLFTLLLLVCVNRLLADRDGSPVPPAGIALAALAMTRPDGVSFVLWSIAAAWGLGRPRDYVVRLAATALGLWGSYWIARWAWYGQPLPNTFYAKGAANAMLLARGGRELAVFAIVIGGPVLLLALLPLLGKARRLAIALWALIAIRVAFELWSGGPTLGRFRFLVPIVPIVQALLITGAVSRTRRPATKLAVAFVAAAFALVPGWLAYPSAERSALAYGVGLHTAHRKLGVDLLQHTTPQAVLAMNDAGFAPLLCDRVNVDMLGLNDLHMAHLPGRFETRVDVDYLLGRHPDIVVLLGAVPRPHLAQDFLLRPHAAIFASPAFRAAYGFSRSYAFHAGYHLLVFRRHGSALADSTFWGGEGAVEAAD